LSTIDTNLDLIRWLLPALAPDQSCEIDFQSLNMRVTWSKSWLLISNWHKSKHG